MTTGFNWLLSQYDTSSKQWAEPPKGRVIHTDMQGGTGQGLGLSAYVLITFLENKKYETEEWSRPIENGLDYLEQQLSGEALDNDPLAVALITYALHLAARQSKQAAFEKLMSMKTEKDGFVYWQKASEAEEEETMTNPPFWRRQQKSSSSSIEITAYALLILEFRVKNKLSDVQLGLPTVKYLGSQRNERGGFHSTQDTVMALLSLSKYAQLINSPDSDMLVSVITSSGKTSMFQRITADNAVLLQTLEISVEDSDDIVVKCEGPGTALVQMNVRYHACNSTTLPGVSVNVNSRLDKKTQLVYTDICAKYQKSEPSGMVVIEMSQLSSYQVVEPAMLLKRYKDSGLKRVETVANKLVMYLDELTVAERCFEVQSESDIVMQDLQMAPVAAYSYYNPQVQDVVMYKPAGLSCNQEEEACGEPPKPDGGNNVVVSMATTVVAVLAAILLI